MIALHELGHYFAGRKLGFTILEYSIGMGPRLLHKTVNGIDYSLRALPLGGSCRFYGEDQEVKDERCFSAQPKWRRAVVLVSGALMNILTALVVAFILLLCYGEYDASTILVESVNDGSPAQAAGMQAGDQITSFDGVRIDSYDALDEQLAAGTAADATVTVDRGGESLTLALHGMSAENEANKRLMGIQINYGHIEYGFFGALGRSFGYCGEVVVLVYKSLWMLLTGQAGINDLAGPTRIVKYISDGVSTAIRGNAEFLLYLIVLISANLGVVNLLPLPALDGGRLVFVGIEAIRGKPVKAETEAIVHFVGFILLMILIVAVTIGDVSSCANGSW